MIKLTVIVPTRNRSSYLTETLDSIALQSLDKDSFEVLVIDNGSTDDTKKVVESFYCKIPHLRYFFESKPGLHVGRHIGYCEATSDILVFADDDIIAFPTWLEGMQESFRDEDVMLVGGKDLPRYEVTPPFWILEKWYELTEYGHSMPELSLIDLGDEIKQIPAYYVYGCNYGIRKRVLDETKGFHPDGMPFELIQYRGDGEFGVNRYIEEHHLKVLYNPKASVYHQVPKSRLTVDYFCKRAFCQGVEMSYSDIRYGINHKTASKGFKYWLKQILGINMLNSLSQIKSMAEKTDIEKQIEKSRITGYQYHQSKYHSDSDLRNWVHRDCYID